MKLLNQYALMFLCYLLSQVGISNAAAPDQWQRHSIEIAGKTRYYKTYLPANVKPNAPAVLILHGGEQSMDKIFKPNAGGTLVWLDIAEREGLVLLVPNGTNQKTGSTDGDKQNWNDLRFESTDDVEFLQKLVEQETQAQQLDAKTYLYYGCIEWRHDDLPNVD
jgi:polyhydroxybutyrate depolymerase